MPTQYFPAPPQAHLEAPVLAPAPYMQPMCLAPIGSSPVPYQVYTPMPVPMQYSSMQDLWVPMHWPANAVRHRPAYATGPDDRSCDWRRQHQHTNHQRHRTLQDPSEPLPEPQTTFSATSATQHSHTQASSSGSKPSTALSVTGPSTPSQAHTSRKQLDHLARCWSPASAATYSNTSTADSHSTGVSSRSDTSTFHPQQPFLNTAAVQSTDLQLNQLRLTDERDPAVSTTGPGSSAAAEVMAQLECGSNRDESIQASAWQGLTEGLLKDIMGLLPPHCNKRCRLVCKRWRDTLDTTLQVPLTPLHMKLVHHLLLPSRLLWTEWLHFWCSSLSGDH